MAQMSYRNKLTDLKLEVAEMKIVWKLVLEPYTICKAAAIAANARVGGFCVFFVFFWFLESNLQMGNSLRNGMDVDEVTLITHVAVWWACAVVTLEHFPFCWGSCVVLFFFLSVSYLFPERCSFGENEEFLNSGLFHQIGKVKIKILECWKYSGF